MGVYVHRRNGFGEFGVQEKSLVRIGGTEVIISDFRLIAATNRNLGEEVKSGRFREDLFYRLNIVPIEVPPLRQRRADIVPIALHYLDLYKVKYKRQQYELTPEDKASLENYSWPGNVRELKSIIERSVLLSEGNDLDLALPSATQGLREDITADTPTLDELQRRYILLTLQKTKNRIGGPEGAAKILGMKRSSLYNRMLRLGILRSR